MFTDFKDPIKNLKTNPIERILVRNDVPFLFYNEQYLFWSQFIDLYEFKRHGIGFIGQYAPEDLPLKAQIQIGKTSRHEDILGFSLKAAYIYCIELGLTLPPDFSEILHLDSINEDIFPWKEIMVEQQITFSHDEGISSRYGVSANICTPCDSLSVTKVDDWPVEVVSQIKGQRILNPEKYISRQAQNHLI